MSSTLAGAESAAQGKAAEPTPPPSLTGSAALAVVAAVVAAMAAGVALLGLSDMLGGNNPELAHQAVAVMSLLTKVPQLSTNTYHYLYTI